MAGRVPARLVGLVDISLTPGNRADLIQFFIPGAQNQLDIRATVVAGELRHGDINTNSEFVTAENS